MTFRDLKLRVRALLAPRRVEQELDEELAFHIERETLKLVERGVAPAEAQRQARATFGSVTVAADECRDARGITLLDTLTRDVLYAFRTFRRAPLASLTIVSTIALGLGLVAVVFTFYSALALRTDAVRNPEELFQVRRPPVPDARTWMAFDRPKYEGLRRETKAFSDTFAMVLDVETRIDGRPVTGTLVTATFFQILGTSAAAGRALTPADDGPVVVLSNRGWTKLFPDGSAAIGQTLLVNGRPFAIVGVMPPDFRGLQLVPPDYWAPLTQLGQLRPSDVGREDAVALDVVAGRLRPGLSRESATAALTAWAARNPDLPAFREQPKTIRLLPMQGTVFDSAFEALASFAPLFMAFGLILLIGCANVANLLLARGLSRQREIGIRLALGASRKRIVRQLLTENCLLALAAAGCGLLLSRVVLHGAIRLAIATVPPDTAELLSLAAFPPDWRVLAFLLAGALVSTLVFALAPALQATRLELVRTMRGEVKRDARPGFARHALLAVQVSASALLLVCAAVFLRSALAAASVDPQVRVVDTVFIDGIRDERRDAMLRAIDADPAIAAVAAVYPGGLRGQLADASSVAGGDSDGTLRSVPVNYKFVSPEYFSVLEIEVAGGRGFAADERSALSGVAIVSDSTARQLWPDGEAVGQRLALDPWRTSGPAPGPELPLRQLTVVGVVPHVRVGLGAFELDGAGVYVPIDATTDGTSLVTRVNGDAEEARRQLSERLSRVDPVLGQIWSLRTAAARGAFVLQLAFWTTAVLAALALALTASGLFSVLSYLVEQRRKEIGVRMALGAMPGHILRLVLRQSLKPVALGVVTGAAFAGALANALISLPVAGQVAEAVRLFDPLAYGASLLCIVIACLLAATIPAARAARVDPIATLREE